MRAVAVACLAVLACGAPTRDPTTTPAPPAIDAAASDATAPATAASEEDAFAKLEPALARCYEDGKKAVPTMTSGKITLLASIDAGGRTTCAVPSNDTGLTQEVEACMLAVVDRATFAKRSATWSLAVPVVVEDGKLARGERREAPPAIETIESQGLTEEIYEVVEGLLPSLYECVRGAKSSGARVITVGARVGASGEVTCALASAPAAIPPETRACTEKVFAKAKFRAPKKGSGLLSVPLNLTR